MAQHSVHVAVRMQHCGFDQEVLLAALLHDASEAYTGDMVTPLKALCPFFQAIELDIQEVVYRRFGVKDIYVDRIKSFDRDSYRLEYRDLMPGDHDDIIQPVGNQPTIVPVSAPCAEQDFLTLFWYLRGMRDVAAVGG